MTSLGIEKVMPPILGSVDDFARALDKRGLQAHGPLSPPPGLEDERVLQIPPFVSQRWAAPSLYVPAKPAGEPAQGWKLVWCHERCHKKENETLCRMLRLALRRTGGALLCLRKAAQFAVWLGRSKDPPAHVLVTDWREAQPCIDLMSQGVSTGAIPSDRHPVSIVVLCANGKQQQRAHEWARRVSPVFRHVVAVNINGKPPASLGEPLRSLIMNHFPGCQAGTQPPLQEAARAQPQPSQDSRSEAELGAEAAGLTPTAGGEGTPFMESIDWAHDAPDPNLTEVLQRYGSAEGESIAMEHLLENACRIRL